MHSEKKNKTMIRIILTIIAFTISIQYTSAQSVMAKANLLYAGSTLTPNIGAEIRLGNRSTLDIVGAYNPWNLRGNEDNNKKFVHWMTQAEFRYWTCQSFDGHFIGAHLLASQYNISQKNLDFIIGRNSKKYRYQGYGWGGGISYGYQWLLSKNWSLETNIGIGIALLDYDKYECRQCGKQESNEQMIYWGTTKFGINLLYFIK